MAKGKKQPAVRCGQGVLLSLGIYVLCLMLIALLAVQDILPENGWFPAVAISAVVASFMGSWWGAYQSPWGRLPAALAVAGGMLIVLFAAGAGIWQCVQWNGRNGILAVLILAAGVLAAMAGGSKKNKKIHATHRGRRL